MKRIILLLIACLCAQASGQGAHCTDALRLENPPQESRCAKLSLFFASKPNCTGTLHKRCCQASDAFFSSNCACASGTTDTLLEHVDSMHSDCLGGDGKRHTRVVDTLLQDATSLLHRKQQRPKPITRTRPAADTGASGDIRLFVGVLSSAKHADRRQAIRESWATDAALHRVVFFVSRPRDPTLFASLRQEAVDRGDVVVLAHVWEAYDNITHQTLEMCRVAALDRQVTHMAKVDDDTYVNTPRLMEELRAAPKTAMFMGYMEYDSHPHRDPSNQWFVSVEDWPTERYPTWAHGTGYVLTVDLVRGIAAGIPFALRPDRLFKLEDVSMGSWVEAVAKEQQLLPHIVHSGRFNFWGCSPSDVVSHYITPAKQRCMHQRHGRCCNRPMRDAA